MPRRLALVGGKIYKPLLAKQKLSSVPKALGHPAVVVKDDIFDLVARQYQRVRDRNLALSSLDSLEARL